MKTKKKACFISLCILFLFLSGCTDILPDFATTDTIVFEAQSTAVQYTISYGFNITSYGNGEAAIQYREDLPSLPQGTLLDIDIINEQLSQSIIVANNTMTEWNITLQDTEQIRLGVNATISTETIFVSDLNGTKALTIDHLQSNHQNLIDQYCNPQGNNSIWLIEPHHPVIKQKAQEILFKSSTENAFEQAKKLFLWLKQQTSYKIHPNQDTTQPATVTLQKKTGDCDDLSFLYMSLLRAVNIPCRSIKGYLISETDGTIQTISHLWVDVFVGGDLGLNGWIPVECAGTGDGKNELYQNFGVEDAFHLRMFLDDGSNASLIQSTSHISIRYNEDMNVDITEFTKINDYQIIESQKLCIEDNIRSYC